MFTLKTVGIATGLVTSATGIAGAVAYSSGAFDSNIQISKLFEEENKYALLFINGDTETSEWNTAWNNYKTDNNNNQAGKDKWGLTGWKPNLATMTADFKKVCGQKATESVKDRNDQKYKDITRYCSRPKSLKEVLAKEGITNLLATSNQDLAWTTKYQSYSTGNNKFPDGTVDTISNHTTLSKACAKVADFKTTDANYSKTYEPFKTWCLQQ